MVSLHPLLFLLLNHLSSSRRPKVGLCASPQKVMSTNVLKKNRIKVVLVMVYWYIYPLSKMGSTFWWFGLFISFCAFFFITMQNWSSIRVIFTFGLDYNNLAMFFTYPIQWSALLWFEIWGMYLCMELLLKWRFGSMLCGHL